MLKYDFQALDDHLHTLLGHQVWIAESLSRDRQLGHDRHFATSTQFKLTLESIHVAISGTTIYLEEREGYYYGLAAHSIVDFSVDERGRLRIVEQFENKTERRTELWVAD